jgi:RNA polymerase sigma-70 factor (ECF subfamily)
MDRAAFSRAFSGSSRALWCIAAAILHDKTAAHDVVQEAAVVALSKIGEFDPRTSFLAWAGQIVRFLALNERRRRQRSQERAELVEGPARAPAEGVVEERLRAELRRAVDGLDDTARACLLMRIVAEMGYKDIAAALGIPEGTAMSHVHRSRQALRKELAPHWGGEETP